MNNFLEALTTSGYTAQQVLSFIKNHAKKLGPGISNAETLGYGAEEILKFLSHRIKPTKQMSETAKSYDSYLSESGLRTREERQEQRGKALKGALGVASGVLTGAALARAIPPALQSLAPALAQKMGKPEIQVADAEVQAPPQPIQPEPQQKPPATGFQKQKEQGFKGLIDAAKEKKKSLPEQLLEQVEQGQGKPIPERSPVLSPEEFDQKIGQPAREEKKNKIVQQLEKESEKLPELGMTPQGDFGEITEVKNGIAKIRTENGVKSRKLSELIKEPDEVRIALHDILQIPESERSAVMDLSVYDPVDKRYYVQYPDGRVVVYKDVPEEDAEAIKIGKGIPKTTGKTKTGEMWAAGIPDSRGAELSARILRNPKYNKENQGKTWYYLQEGYDKYNKIRYKPGKKKPKT